MSKKYWCVTYLETDPDGNTSFGNIGSMIYDTYDDAFNAMENDVKEYVASYHLTADSVDHVDGTNHWEFIHASNLKMEWEIQMMNNSLEVNEVEEAPKEMPERMFYFGCSIVLNNGYRVWAKDETEAEHKGKAIAEEDFRKLCQVSDSHGKYIIGPNEWEWDGWVCPETTYEMQHITDVP